MAVRKDRKMPRYGATVGLAVLCPPKSVFTLPRRLVSSELREDGSQTQAGPCESLAREALGFLLHRAVVELRFAPLNNWLDPPP